MLLLMERMISPGWDEVNVTHTGYNWVMSEINPQLKCYNIDAHAGRITIAGVEATCEAEIVESASKNAILFLVNEMCFIDLITTKYCRHPERVIRTWYLLFFVFDI